MYYRGLELLNHGRYFEAHEVLEDVWRATPGQERQFLQGLIQVAVALHHQSTGNLEGAGSVMRRAAHNLSAYSGDFGNIDVSALRTAVERWRRALRDGAAFPEPTIRILRPK